MESLYSSWIEISRSAYRKNIEFFKGILNAGTELAVVIKANAYGHGMVEIAHFADECGIKVFCVHSIDEALTLRKHGFTQRIVVVGPTIKRMAQAAVE
ncbi:alanine racemase, partial [bacterium]|nr:alanine racemase [bacterium]